MKKAKAIKDPCHISGAAIVSGSAKYIADEVKPDKLLYAKIVTSMHAHAKIKKIDLSSALAISGVIAILTAKDIPGENQIGHTIKDEPLLADDEVCYIGQPIAIVVAKNPKIALRASKEITVIYKKLAAIFTIDEAVKAKNFYVNPCKIERGSIKKGFEKAHLVFAGEVTTGAQEHAYFETQRTLAMPGDDQNITLYASTQNTAEVQEIAARVLGIRSKDVTVDVKRLGGGFGGKERGPTLWSCLAALAAYVLHQPVLLALTRREDMSFTGKRHPFRSRYKVGVEKNGKILAYDVEFCSNGGAFADLSIPILQRAMFHADNAYFIPDVRIIGKACKTNLPPNTAFRGFGAPQGIFTMENVIEAIADKLNLDPLLVREVNLYKNGEHTPFGQPVYEPCHSELFARLKKMAHYEQLSQEVKNFNQENKYIKHGIGIVPIKFGISFTFTPLNQGTALIWVYADGSVSMSHGGIEMGQEVNTKVAQVVARELGINIARIRMESSNTQRNGNASPTAASTGADINGNAALNAAKRIRARLAIVALELLRAKIGYKYLENLENRAEDGNALPDCDHIIFADDMVYDVRYPKIKITFNELVYNAYMQRRNLGAQGFYRTPKIFFNGEKMQGSPFYYFLFGVALVMMEVDVLTGANKLMKVYVVHEAGHSLNKSVDYGQIHGAFFQGFGYSTMEELKFNKEGQYLANTFSTYKIPSFQDLPEVFDIEFVERELRYASVFGSKAIGEPPLIYGEAAYFAIKNALQSINPEKKIHLAMPATPEAIIISINDAGGI
ncbi:Xanthine dehydrogenase molybdopterin binding subunit [Gammaproteobacteria bacterium]